MALSDGFIGGQEGPLLRKWLPSQESHPTADGCRARERPTTPGEPCRLQRRRAWGTVGAVLDDPKARVLPVVLALLALAAACAPAVTAPLALRADVDGDGEAERLLAYIRDDRRMGVLSVESSVRWGSQPYALWGVRAGDLDGDGSDEVLLGVWSRVRRHAEPEPHRTVWVLGWDGGQLVERWRGSALARPLVDFGARDADGDGRAELLALERSRDRCRLAAYRWTGFGFAGLGAVAVACDVALAADGTLTAGGARLAPALDERALALRELP